ncbi:MAG: fibronectin type III domain-containing protein [Bacteroidetes bacterium]|nr:fibronectin type III domain-containing protein [Bacteroidota bacterium]MBU1372279.1 fibronectin type III domain-containing protein [Bacteroidota bacterium]MBU1486042.1 fibronectin type III domain-containing protein [Bacteroidota bacterium]MBU1761991.1 fibronectin type III domain-containing protein [Bacteroidota bacterium]MBU2045573.1 fibronectin type III domain-containing protein [Bacteroidota bacterium]
MKQLKLILDYSKLSDANLNTKSKAVVIAMTGNDSFPSTTPTLAEFTNLQTAYNYALDNCSAGGKVLIAIKNQAKIDLLNGMRQLAMDVDAQSNGDRTMLVSSGFELASMGDNPTNLGAPTDFKIMDGMNNGELKFTCKKADNAVSYLVEYTDELPAETTQWKIQPTTSRETTVKGLRSGIRVYGRIKAIGRKGQEANSDVLSRVVQ